MFFPKIIDVKNSSTFLKELREWAIVLYFYFKVI